MDREQYHRIVIDEHIKVLIDEWHICPYSDKVDELFETFKTCTKAYLKHDSLTTRAIVNIVKDLRGYLNPHRNKNLVHFTDKICDAILFKFQGLTEERQEHFEDYVQECLLQVYTRV